MQVEELLLVWNADAGLRGHLHYALQKLRGIDECTLCEITHGAVSEKSEWKAGKQKLPVPVTAVYRNRLSAEQSRAVDGEFPCVLARTPDGLTKVLRPSDIIACDGRLDIFVERLRNAIT